MDDLISRQAAIEEIRNLKISVAGKDVFPNEAKETIIKTVNELPPATPEEVGTWEYVQYDANPEIGNWHCSKCRAIITHMPIAMGFPLLKYCPYCGNPKMEEGEDKE